MAKFVVHCAVGFLFFDHPNINKSQSKVTEEGWSIVGGLFYGCYSKERCQKKWIEKRNTFPSGWYLMGGFTLPAFFLEH